MIQHEASIQVSQQLGTVFAFVDDFSRAPSWLEAGGGVRTVPSEGRVVGSRLHYVYDHRGHRGEMDGVVTSYERDRRLEMRFEDPTFQVEIAFRLAAEGGGTVVTHGVIIRPKR